MDKALSQLPPLRDVIQEHGLRAEKSLGQNFILDQNLTDKIVRAAGDITNHHVFEIGPGPGGLTRSILRGGAKYLTAIEFDARAIAALQSLINVSDNKLTLVQADALRTDLIQCEPILPRKIIANLPYNIATTLLIGWLKQIRNNHDCFDSMTLMFQREVAERIVAQPKSKAYGRISVMAQWLCEASIAFDVPPTAFVPSPKVTSSIVHFRPKASDNLAPDFDVMEKVVAAAFNQRRKMIRSSLKKYLPSLQKAGIEETLRAEDLSVNDYILLAKAVQNT